MAAGNYNFTIEQGTTVDFQIAYTDSNGNPIDLTDYDARMQLKNTKGGNTTYLTLSSSYSTCGTGLHMSGSGDINPPTSGTIGIYISAMTSSMLTFDQAVYDLEIASGSGNCTVVTRILEGKVKLSKEVTTGNY